MRSDSTSPMSSTDRAIHIPSATILLFSDTRCIRSESPGTASIRGMCVLRGHPLSFVAHTSPVDTVRHVLLSWQFLHENILVQVLQLQDLVPHIQNQRIQLPPIITGRLHTTSCRVPSVAYTMSIVRIHDSSFKFNAFCRSV